MLAAAALLLALGLALADASYFPGLCGSSVCVTQYVTYGRCYDFCSPCSNIYQEGLGYGYGQGGLGGGYGLGGYGFEGKGLGGLGLSNYGLSGYGYGDLGYGGLDYGSLGSGGLGSGGLGSGGLGSGGLGSGGLGYGGLGYGGVGGGYGGLGLGLPSSTLSVSKGYAGSAAASAESSTKSSSSKKSKKTGEFEQIITTRIKKTLECEKECSRSTTCRTQWAVTRSYWGSCSQCSHC